MKSYSSQVSDLWPLTGDVNTTDHLFIIVSVSEHFSLRVTLETGKMGKHKNLSGFDDGHIVMVRSV